MVLITSLMRPDQGEAWLSQDGTIAMELRPRTKTIGRSYHEKIKKWNGKGLRGPP
jgi:hypothetical protein